MTDMFEPSLTLVRVREIHSAAQQKIADGIKASVIGIEILERFANSIGRKQPRPALPQDFALAEPEHQMYTHIGEVDSLFNRDP